jgi:MbtH protein
MVNPFEDEAGSYYVLRNSEGQYSLWPEFVDVPEGWSPALGPRSRSDCLSHIEKTWSDMRPSSMIAATAQSRSRSATSAGDAD